MPESLPFKYYSVHTLGLVAASTTLTWGSYFVYDYPGELFYPLQKWFGAGYDDSANLALYSAYSWPTVVLAFVGGMIIDRLNVRTGALMFMALVMVGQLVFTFGVVAKVYWVCVVGRLILGSGSEALVVAQNAFILRWFGNGPAVAMIFGVLTLVRASSAIGFLVLPSLADEGGIPLVIWVGTAVCGICCLMCVLTAILDKLGEPILVKRSKERPEGEGDRHTLLSMSGRRLSLQEVSSVPPVSIKQIREFPTAFWVFLVSISLLLNSFWNFSQVVSDIVQNSGPYSAFYDQLPARDMFAQCVDYAGNIPSYYRAEADTRLDCQQLCDSLKDCSGYQFSVNASEANCFYFASESTEVQNSSSFVPQLGGTDPVRYGSQSADTVMCFKREHQFSPTTASMYAGLPNFVSILSPLCGMFVDRHGKALYVLMLSSAMFILAYIAVVCNALGWLFIHPLVLMLWAGFALTFALSVAEPTISVIIAPRLLGTAYGCYASLINLFSALFALLVGAVQDSQSGTIREYTLPMYIFILMASLAGVLFILVLFLDKRVHRGFSPMNASVAERNAKEEGTIFLMRASSDAIF